MYANDALPENTIFGNVECRRSICYTNNKCDQINKLWNEREAPSGCSVVPATLHNNTVDIWRIYSGLPVVSKKSIQDSKLFEQAIQNNEDFIVEKVTGKVIDMVSKTKNIFTGIIHLKKIKVPAEHFDSYFGLGYAITVTRSIGSTFDEPISIYEWSHFFMIRNNKYTAITRTTKIENINIMDNVKTASIYTTQFLK